MAGPLLFVLVAVAFRVGLDAEGTRRWTAFWVANELADRTGIVIQLSGVRFRWNMAPCLENVSIDQDRPGLRLSVIAKEACIEHWASAIGSGFRAVEIRLDAPSIRVLGANKDAPAPSSPTQKRPILTANPKQAPLREVALVFDDLSLEWADLPVPPRLSKGMFGPIDGSVTVQTRAGQSAATIEIREPESNASLTGRATPSDTGWDLAAGVQGDLVPLFGGFLDTIADLDLRKMPMRGTVGVRYARADQHLTIDLDLEESDVDVASDVVAKERLAGFSARQRARIEANLKNQTLQMSEAVVELNDVPVILSVEMQPGETSPAFSVEAELKTIGFVRFLSSIPGTEDLRIIDEASPALTFALTASVSGELSAPGSWQPYIDYRLEIPEGQEISTGLEFLSQTFEYYPLTPNGRATVPRIVDPATWIPYDRIPYVQRRAIVVSEDANFPFHRGVDLEEVKAALQKAIETGEPARGGSSITQQLIKNLFLTRDRTALRKILELILTFHMEAVLSKAQIFETYCNLIEWGPELYGLKEASRHYFGRYPRGLKPIQMGYLALIIPSPVRYHQHFEDGRVPPRFQRNVRNLLKRLNRLEQLSDKAFAASKDMNIRFRKKRRR